MNKGELVDAVAAKAEVTKKQADSVISATIEAIMEAVSSGDKVTLVGFVSLKAVTEKQEKGVIRKLGKKWKFPLPMFLRFLRVNYLKRV